MDKVYENGLNWFGMSPHPTDRMFNNDTSKQRFRVRADAKDIREDYDAIVNGRPDLADALNRLIFKSTESGYDEGYRHGRQDGNIFGEWDDE